MPVGSWSDLMIFKSTDFRYFQHFTTFVPHTSQMDQNIHARGDLSSYGFQRQLYSHKSHCLQAGQHIPGRVGMSCTQTSFMTCINRLYMDSLCSHHAEIQYLYLIYTVYNVIILPFHSCKKKRAPFTALFHIDFLIHLSYSTVCQPMSLNFFPKMG